MQRILLSLLVSLLSLSATALPKYKTRGVNIGGWLVLEKWITPSFFENTPDWVQDEYTLTQYYGSNAQQVMETHWSTWFTEQDLKLLILGGINSVRIPVGYWSFDLDNSIEPYAWGAQAHLDQAIEWCKKWKVSVWIDLHGAPGSQNGFDNSGRSGPVEWQTGWGNIERSKKVLGIISEKYGHFNYSGVVSGIQMLNEPVSWGNNNVDTTRQYYADGYKVIEANLESPWTKVILHDAFMGLDYWSDFPQTYDAPQIAADIHKYSVFDTKIKSLNVDGLVTNVCSYAEELYRSSQIMPTYVGEWSAATDLCAYDSGYSCAESQCPDNANGASCVSQDYSTWSPTLISHLRRFVEAQLDVYEYFAFGWFFWNFKTEYSTPWDFIKGVELGFIPSSLNYREFPTQCGFIKD